MRILFAAVLAAPGWALAAPPAPGGETPPLLTLEEATARALDAAPGLHAAGADVDAAEGAIWQARVRPNPELGFEAENILGTGELAGFEGGEYTLGIGRRIELGGKRRARIAVAQGEREAALRAREAARLDVIHEVHRAFIEVQAAEAAVRNAVRRAELARNTVETMKVRTTRGRDSQATLHRAEVHAAEARMELDLARQEAETARALLAALWNGTDSRFTVPAVGFTRLADDPPEVRSGTSADLALLKAQEQRAAAAVRLEQAGAVQDPVIGLGVRYIPEADDLGVVAEVSIPLAFFDTHRGNIEQAKALREKARWTLAAERLRLERERITLERQLAAARSEVLSIRDDLLPKVRNALQLARRGYERGAFDYPDVLEAEGMLQDLNERHVRALRNYHLAHAALNRLTARGGRPAGADDAETP